jgi:hypothetical protein
MFGATLHQETQKNCFLIKSWNSIINERLKCVQIHVTETFHSFLDRKKVKREREFSYQSVLKSTFYQKEAIVLKFSKSKFLFCAPMLVRSSKKCDS